MKYKLLLILILMSSSRISGQSNVFSTNADAEKVMLGQYDPTTYSASTIIDAKTAITSGILSGISPDSLKHYLGVLSTFETRNTGSDTVSSTRGIGAARRWAYSKFMQFSKENENRLLPSYLQFDANICGVGRHKNIFAVLPGSDTSNKDIIIIEAHLDSRCAAECDTACTAHGMEDNGSGSALVLELARVMSKYTFDRTIVFLLTIAEEQNLGGAKVFANYAFTKGIEIRAVLNNDIVGGILCGATASPPGCPGENDIDSTHVKIFSDDLGGSASKRLARYTKLQYKEEILPTAKVPMEILIMTPEDRTGRGGDHIPFRQRGHAAIRVTSANEHGDASNATGYHDRQHTEDDILGVDTDGDQIIDSFFVDFNYLARNTSINAIAAAMAATGPETPGFTVTPTIAGLEVSITSSSAYRVALRSNTQDWDTVYTFAGGTAGIINPPVDGLYYLSAAAMDDEGIESLFSPEETITYSSINKKTDDDILLLSNRPNPFDEATTIVIHANKKAAGKTGVIKIMDVTGKTIREISLELQEGNNEVLYRHGYHAKGVYYYSLTVDGELQVTRKMVFGG